MAATETHGRATSAVDDLYRRHVGDVYRYTYAVLGNHADAEDVTQTTFVNALRALERGEQPRNAANWLLAIAHNLVRQRWRQAATRPAEVELAHDVPARAGDDEVELASLVKALQRIPPAQREAIVMRELEGRSYREISELLSLSTSALETLLFRARRSLAEELENVVTCETAELAISKRLDGRLGRKERRRLATHLADCPACARLGDMQTRQRRAFKGLAVLPLPVGLALFKGAPAATAAVGLPTIGGAIGGGAVLGTVGTASSTGTATAAGSAATGMTAAGSGAAAGGAAAAGGTLLGGVAAKVAAVVVVTSVATGVGYEGVKAVQDTSSTPPASVSRSGGGAGSSGTPQERAAAASRAATPTTPVRAGGVAGAPGREKQSDPPGRRTGQVSSSASDTRSTPSGDDRGNSAVAHESATPTRHRTGQTEGDGTKGRPRKTIAKGNANGSARETAEAARARAAAKKVARDAASASAAATTAKLLPKEPTGASTAAMTKQKGKPAPTAPAGPEPATPVADGSTTTPADDTGGHGGGPPADPGANGKGKDKG